MYGSPCPGKSAWNFIEVYSPGFAAKTASASGKLDGNATANDMDIEAWKDLLPSRGAYYIFVVDAQDTVSNGVFEVSYPSTSGQIDFTNKITIDADGDYTSTEEGIILDSELRP